MLLSYHIKLSPALWWDRADESTLSTSAAELKPDTYGGATHTKCPASIRPREFCQVPGCGQQRSKQQSLRYLLQ